MDSGAVEKVKIASWLGDFVAKVYVFNIPFNAR